MGFFKELRPQTSFTYISCPNINFLWNLRIYFLSIMQIFHCQFWLLKVPLRQKWTKIRLVRKMMFWISTVKVVFWQFINLIDFVKLVLIFSQYFLIFSCRVFITTWGIFYDDLFQFLNKQLWKFLCYYATKFI